MRMATALETLLATSLPEELFHYTSQDGLQGIVGSGELWASKITHLNDSSELSLTLETARKYVNSLDLSNRVRGGIIRDLELLESSANNLFVFSLTENGDQLSQWRGYTPPGSGYSIGFAASELKLIAEQSGDFALGPCSYSAEVRQDVVAELVAEVLSKKLHLRTPRRQYTPRTRWHSPQFGDALLFAAPFLKHEAFAEEKEWRLVSKPIGFKHPNVYYRTGRSHLIPYFKLSIRNKANKIPLRSITLGPTPHPRLASAAVESFLISTDMQTFTIRWSSIPFRQW
jgi:Protein of unknown function (DUF2971)